MVFKTKLIQAVQLDKYQSPIKHRIQVSNGFKCVWWLDDFNQQSFLAHHFDWLRKQILHNKTQRSMQLAVVLAYIDAFYARMHILVWINCVNQGVCLSRSKEHLHGVFKYLPIICGQKTPFSDYWWSQLLFYWCLPLYIGFCIYSGKGILDI